jgi:hypothetical protein
VFVGLNCLGCFQIRKDGIIDRRATKSVGSATYIVRYPRTIEDKSVVRVFTNGFVLSKENQNPTRQKDK